MGSVKSMVVPEPTWTVCAMEVVANKAPRAKLPRAFHNQDIGCCEVIGVNCFIPLGFGGYPFILEQSTRYQMR